MVTWALQGSCSGQGATQRASKSDPISPHPSRLVLLDLLEEPAPPCRCSLPLEPSELQPHPLWQTSVHEVGSRRWGQPLVWGSYTRCPSSQPSLSGRDYSTECEGSRFSGEAESIESE